MRKFIIAAIAAAGITALPAYAQGVEGSASPAPGDPATKAPSTDPLAAQPSTEEASQGETKAKRKLDRSAASADSREAPANASREGSPVETPAATAPNVATPEIIGAPAN